MAQQNINQYVFNKLRLNIVNECQDISLASDEVNYNQEVVFSPYIIADTYGNKLPINIDISDPNTVQNLNLSYKQYNFNNVFVSQNYYNPENKDLLCFSSSTSCDIGLTGIDNGLVTSMYGNEINFTNGLYNDSLKFNRLYYDRRFKMFQVTGYTSQNVRFSGIPDTTLYEVVSKPGPTGKYHELYGGFYQGFYRLFGYDYNIFPERMNKGWSVEMILKPRLIDEYFPSSGETTLNEIYPENSNIFFYFGTRAENKFYHHADGTPNCFTGYTRVTNGLEECAQTCACCETADTEGRCVYLYPPRSENNQYDPHLNYGCNQCGGNKEKQLTCGCGCGNSACNTCGWECFTHIGSCTPNTLAFQICNSNGIFDDNFEVFLNGTSIGELIFTSSTITGSIFIADSTSGATFNSYPFGCPLSGMSIYYFDPVLLNEGSNQIFMDNIQNNLNGNFGTVQIYSFKELNSSLYTPKSIFNGGFSGNSGLDFTFNFNYYSGSTPTPTPTPIPTPTPDCNNPTPVCTPTCTTCTECVECETCAVSGITSIENTCETNPLFDSMSNAIALKLCGDKENPQIGVKILRWTGNCETTGTCVTGQTYVTGYTIDEYCSPNGIYDYCEIINPPYLLQEHWFQVDVVWERYTWLDICDLWWRGGLGDITKFEYLDSLANDTTKLISPPITHGTKIAEEIELVNLDQSWLDDTHFRMGRLKIYVNGKIFFRLENIEEIIPRGLSTDKEKQLGVPFNISWGGGTQGLRENLTLSACTALYGKYIQDPECFPTELLDTTSLSGLDTNILLEQNFAGTFEGGISQFRMYVEPLSAPEVKHNFLLLKDTFDMLNPDCPDCSTIQCLPNDFTYTLVELDFLVTQNYYMITTQGGDFILVTYNIVDIDFLVTQNYYMITTQAGDNILVTFNIVGLDFLVTQNLFYITTQNDFQITI